MNFNFKVDDHVEIRSNPGQRLVLIRGFDRTAASFRVWWADPIVDGVPRPGKRVRVQSADLIRVERPSETAELAARAEAFKLRKLDARVRKAVRDETHQKALMRKKGNFNLQTGRLGEGKMPFSIPAGKWLNASGVEALREFIGAKPPKEKVKKYDSRKR